MDLFKSSIVTPQLLAEIRRLQFQARRLADESVSGGYRSAFRGHGIEFEEVREYFPGDDIRAIDWKVTARSRKPYIKSYREERELTVMVAVDVSASTKSGTAGQLRAELIAKVGAVLTLIALKNNDKVGLVTFSDRIETYHPPRKARSSVWRILHEVLSPAEYRLETDFDGVFAFLSRVLKRRAIVFVISDFLSDGFEKSLAVLAKRHDVTAMLVQDRSERSISGGGIVSLVDPESGRAVLFDLGSEKTKSEFHRLAAAKRDGLRKSFRRFGVGCVELFGDKPFMGELRRYFEARRPMLRAR